MTSPIVANAQNQTQNQIYVLSILFIGAIGFFLVWIYLALAIEERFHLSKPMIGAIAGSMVLVSSGLSWFGGNLCDRYGHVRVLQIGMIVYVPVVIVLAMTSALPTMIAMILAMGLVRTVTTPATKTLCIMADDGSGRMFRFRYLAVTGAFASTGIIAMLWHPKNHGDLFLLAILVMGLTAAMSIFLPHNFASPNRGETKTHKPYGEINRSALFALLGYGGCLFMLLSQFETNLPLHLIDVFGKVEGARIYSVEVILGSGFAFIIALINDQFMARFPETKMKFMMIFGVIAISMSSVFMYLGTSAFAIYFGSVIFVVAEVMLFPLMDSLATRFMTEDNRGRIMGLLEIRQIGFFVGPVLGAVFLTISPIALILFLVLCAIGFALCYLLLSRIF